MFRSPLPMAYQALAESYPHNNSIQSFNETSNSHQQQKSQPQFQEVTFHSNSTVGVKDGWNSGIEVELKSKKQDSTALVRMNACELLILVTQASGFEFELVRL